MNDVEHVFTREDMSEFATDVAAQTLQNFAYYLERLPIEELGDFFDKEFSSSQLMSIHRGVCDLLLGSARSVNVTVRDKS